MYIHVHVQMYMLKNVRVHVHTCMYIKKTCSIALIDKVTL